MNVKEILNRIYALSPVFLQDLAVSLYGLILYYQRYGFTYQKYLKIYSQRKSLSIDNEIKLQNEYFLKLLNHAITLSPFYKDFYKDVDLSQIRSVEDIYHLPILTKEILKSNIDKVFTISAKEGLKFFTGGTTGKPMMVLKRKEDVQSRMAYLDAYKLKFGFVNNKMRSARFFGKNIIPKQTTNHVFWRNNYISKQRFYSTYYLTPENLRYYVEDLNKYKPQAIDGFVSAIYEIAKYIIDYNVTLTFTPKAIFTTAETVLPFHRETIEKAFSCPLSDQYASNEGAPFITQCPFGSYHENIDTGVFEHIATPNGVKLVVTSFDTFGTPLIRYDIGDYIIERKQNKCKCGSTHPCIGFIEGRSSDFLFSKHKGKISAANISVLVSELPNSVEGIQFEQINIHTIVIRVVINEKFITKNLEKLLLEKMISYFGSDIEYRIEAVSKIKRSESGKFRLIINHVGDFNGSEAANQRYSTYI